MQKQVITISRKKYAVGLFWQPVALGTAPRDHVVSLARKVDKKLGLFVEYRSMVGLGGRKKGHASGMPAAAPEILEAFSEYSSFLACFIVPQGFLIVAVRNGIIIADKVYETDIDAKTAYTSLSVLPDWGVLIAPTTWKVPRAIDKPLDELVSGDGKSVLKPLSNFRGYLFTLLFFGIFVFGAFYLFREPLIKMITPATPISEINPELAEEYKRRLEEKNAEINQTYQPVIAVPVAEPAKMPYEELPNMYDRTSLCWQAIGFLMQPIPGWIQLTVDCDMDTASARLRRDYGTLADLYAVAPELMHGIEITEMSDSDVILRVNLPLLDTYFSLEDLDSASVMRDINSIFQLIGTDADVRLGTEEILSNGEYQFVNFVQISARSKLTPKEFVRVFDSIDGVSFPKISWDSRQKSWNYEVRVYVR